MKEVYCVNPFMLIFCELEIRNWKKYLFIPKLLEFTHI